LPFWQKTFREAQVPVDGSAHRSLVHASASSQSASTVQPLRIVMVVVDVVVVVKVVTTKLVAVHDVEVVVVTGVCASAGRTSHAATATRARSSIRRVRVRCRRARPTVPMGPRLVHALARRQPPIHRRPPWIEPGAAYSVSAWPIRIASAPARTSKSVARATPSTI
jgi:hypothetical protein